MRLSPPPGNPEWVVFNPDAEHPEPKKWTPSVRRMTAELCKRSFGDFVEQAWGAQPELKNTPFSWGWHIDVLCDHIQAVLEPQIPLKEGEKRAATMPRTGLPRAACRHLIINVPPGTMKSLLLNVFAPAWMWTRRPSWSVICASGNEDALLRDSVRCRDLLRSEWYQQLFEPAWKFSEDTDGKEKFQNDQGGWRAVKTVGQAVTGDRADALFIDDPNDAQKIRSAAYRKSINTDWWSNAFSNRLNSAKRGVRIIIMQRLHEEDLVGYILARNKLRCFGGTWEQIIIPQEAEEKTEVTATSEPKDVIPGQNVPTFLGWKDPRTAPGELMMPHMFPPEYVEGEKIEKGSAGYAGQHQQRPSPKDGDRFLREWWRFWRYDGAPLVQPNRPKGTSGAAAELLPLPTEWEDSVESWDFTFKKKETNDWVVGLKVVKVGARRYVVDMWRKHTGFKGGKAGVVELRTRMPRVTGAIVIEDKANGTAIQEDMEATIPGLIAYTPKDGKEQRAAVMEPQVEAGQWYLPDGAHWLETFIDEFAAFPNGKHDDCVDAASQACARFGQDSELEQAKILWGWATAQ